MGQRGHQAGADRVGAGRENNRDRGRRPARRHRRHLGRRKNQLRLARHQFNGKTRKLGFLVVRE